MRKIKTIMSREEFFEAHDLEDMDIYVGRTQRETMYCYKEGGEVHGYRYITKHDDGTKTVEYVRYLRNH
jgi:hypothetical protein